MVNSEALVLQREIVMFYPNVPKNAIAEVAKVLDSRWIGQGPRVDEFEELFNQKFSNPCTSIAVGSGTDALHLAYLLADINKDDEVIVPLFTCTATNIPLLYIGAKLVFCDVDSNLNVDVSTIEQLITPRTKAIVCVHFGGLPCDMDVLWDLGKKYNIKIIEDAAHALGAEYNGKLIGSQSDFSIFSFQAIKHITTGDGGMLLIKDPSLVDRAKKLRWFGIDRTKKQTNIWDNDITEIGYKYQMNDIAASIGIASMYEFDDFLNHRITILNRYKSELSQIDGLRIMGAASVNTKHAAWMLTIEVDRRTELMAHLKKHGVESSMVHFRNDEYSIFEEKIVGKYPNMDAIENRYLALPIHMKMTEDDVDFIAHVIRKGW